MKTSISAAIVEPLKVLQDQLSPKTIITDGDEIAPWLTDWRGRYHGRALALAQPDNVPDLSKIVRLCADRRIAIVPQGGNSGMSGGATPDGTGKALLLSLRRMNRIREFDANERTVVAEAGVILQNLHELTEKKGLRFPLTLGGKGSATIGGLVSTNAGGTQVLQHGNMREQVLGIEAVLPDGQVHNGLPWLKKDNRGYDLKHLFIGAEGTLGVVTAARLRLLPTVIDRAVIWCGLSDLRTAKELMALFQEMSGPRLEGFEILPGHCLSNVLSHVPDTRNPLADIHEWNVLIEIVRSHEDDSAPDALGMQILEAALDQGLVNDATIASSEAQAEQLWRIRDSISEAERAQGPAVQHDISVPVRDMADFIIAAVKDVENAFPGTRAVAFGHMGDGNVHFHVIAPKGSSPDRWYSADAGKVSHHVNDLVTSWSGSISAEHGIGQMKAGELERLASPARMHALRAIKQGFDPLNIMNPGKIIPL